MVYLSSQQSKDFFPENKGSDFSNYLPSPISVDPDSYEVALTEIFYTPKRQVLKFFKNKDDRYIKIHTLGRRDKEVTVSKENEDVPGWILKASLELLDKNFEVEISEDISAHGSHVIITNKNVTKVFLLPTNLAEALGFSTSRFETGEHMSPNPINEEKFDKLENDITLYLDMDHTTRTLTVQEPSNYSFEDVLKEINEALEQGNTETTIAVTPSGTTVTSNGGIGLEFSRRISKTFGLPNTLYPNTTPYTIPTVIQWEPEPCIMCISCDIMHPTLFGSKTTSWLRILQQSTNYGQQQHLTFNPPTFHSVTKPFFQSIHILITDEQERQFDFGSEAVTLTLQFREKQ